jgi:hypothetical protein
MKEFEKIKDGLRQGQSGKSLGLVSTSSSRSSAMERFVNSLRGPFGDEPSADDYDLEAVEALGGEERLSAEQVLLARLEDGDLRALRALVNMRSRLAIDALAEALPTAEGPFAEEAARALKVLRR